MGKNLYLSILCILGLVFGAVSLLFPGLSFAQAVSKADIRKLYQVAEKGDTDQVEALLKKGVPTEPLKDKKVNPPLSIAVMNGHKGVVMVLLDNGADINARGWASWTPLIFAAYKNQPKMAKFLIKRGADLDLGSGTNQTALMIAIISNEKKITKYLIKAGADIHLVGRINLRNAFIEAARMPEFTSILKKLDQMGAKTDIIDDEGKDALMWAAEEGALKNVQYLIKKGFDINAVSPHGFTALHLASSNGMERMVAYLLKIGANPALKDANDQTALSLAKEKKQEKVVQVFEKSKVSN